MPENQSQSVTFTIDNIKAILHVISFAPLYKLFTDIPPELQKLKVSQIQLNHSDSKILQLSALKGLQLNGSLHDKTLGFFGACTTNFKEQFSIIQNANPESTLRETIETTIEALNQVILKTYLPQLILDYTYLYESFKRSDPSTTNEAIFASFNTIFEEKKANGSFSPYGCFTLAYQNKYETTPPYFSQKNKLSIYNLTKELKENFDLSYRKTYLNIIFSLEEFYRVAIDKEDANDVVSNIKFHANNYFSTLLKLSITQNVETKTERTEAFENFLTKSLKEIDSYKTKHPAELTKTRNLLDNLLWLIIKLVPFVNKETRMALFGGYTKNGVQLEKLEQAVTTKIIAAPAA